MAETRRSPRARPPRASKAFIVATSFDASEDNLSPLAAQAALAYLSKRFGLRPEVGRIVAAATGLGGAS